MVNGLTDCCQTIHCIFVVLADSDERLIDFDCLLFIENTLTCLSCIDFM